MTIVATISATVNKNTWSGKVSHNGEIWAVDLMQYNTALIPDYRGDDAPVARGVGTGVDYRRARDVAIQRSGLSEEDWYRIIYMLDQLVHESNSVIVS